MTPTAVTFRSTLKDRLTAAAKQGRAYVDIRSGDIHRQTGGYPGTDHRLPVCCKAMRAAMKTGDMIRTEPPTGDGASLVIRYQLPR